MKRCIVLAGIIALAAPAAASAQSDPFVEAIRGQARIVLEQAKKKGFKNIGVLKFQVRKGTAAPSDDVGELNTSLALKTENALIVENRDNDFFILENPSQHVVREKLLSANHKTPEGRKAFFDLKYPVRWTRDKVTPSGFLIGTATITEDRKTVTLELKMFDATGAEDAIPGGKISAPASPELLAEAGESYTQPEATVKALVSGGPIPSKQVLEQQATENMRVSDPPKALDAKKPQPFAPLVNCPVRMTILYNGQPVSVNGNSVPEPGPKDKVAFHLKNTSDKGTFGVVLMVNGDSTLYQERLTPFACHKWILVPGAEVTIRGFQTSQNKVAPFAVLPPDAVDPDEFRYGEHAGTFRLVVYHGKMSTTPPTDNVASLTPDQAAERTITRTRGAVKSGDGKPQTLEELQADLRGRAAAAEGSRGYVTKSKNMEEFQTEATYFTPSPETPVSDISIRYYTPKK